MKSHIQKVEDGYFIPIPDEMLNQLGWELDDEILLETTLDCYPKGEVTSIILANITKNSTIVEGDDNESKA